jgi:Mg-chelatase subunit ChlD
VRRFTLLACLLLAACQEGSRRPSPADYTRPSHPSEPDEPDGSVIIGTDAGCGQAPAGNYCGQTFLREADNPPNIYFVVDRSGSMGAPFEGSVVDKYQAARGSIIGLLRNIGHRVRYGAAIFPSKLGADMCTPGEQIFSTTLGDPAACAAQGVAGPLLRDLSARLASVPPDGATPTAATLEAIRPTLTELEGETFVVLVTDGAPNCNLDTACPASKCTLNIEMLSVDGRDCNASYNCCDAANTGPNAPGFCVDDAASEQAVSALADAGIMTYVIGMPGAEPYAELLNRLAAAGGTARGAETDYYAVGDAEALRGALQEIGTGIAISCSIDLEVAPEDPARVNVYFDGEVVPADDADGWGWDGDRRIEVNGGACDRLKSGDVLEARVVFGCDTVVR